MEWQHEVTEDQFMEYVSIQESGVTNMFNVRMVCELSFGSLDKEDCLYIMAEYGNLMSDWERRNIS